jgi:CHAT domain-containing protein/predicted negative regulator of RcsB-dependent stress response
MRDKEKNQSLIAKNYFNLGIASLETKAFQKSQQYFKKAATIYQSDSVQFKRQLIRCISELGILNRRIKNYDDALSYYVSAIDGFRSSGDSMDLAKTQYNLGNLYYEINSMAKARYHYKKSLELYRSRNERNLIGIAMANDAVSRTYRKQSAYDLAEQYLLIAYDYAGQSLGEDHRYSVGIRERLSDTYGLSGQYDQAVKLLLEIENISPNKARTNLLLSKNYSAIGEHDKAEHHAKLALKYLDNKKTKTLEKINIHLSVARAYINNKKYKKASKSLNRAERLCLDNYEEPPRIARYIHLNRARILASQNEFKKAITIIDTLLQDSSYLTHKMSNGQVTKTRTWDDLARAKCKIYFNQFDHDPSEDNWHRAIDYANFYLSSIDTMRQQAALIGSKSSLAGRPNEIVEEVLRLLEIRFNQVNDQELINDAMIANDMIRDMLWLDLFMERDVTGLTSKDIGKLKRSYNLRKEIVTLTLQKSESSDSLDIKERIIKLKETLAFDSENQKPSWIKQKSNKDLKEDLISELRKKTDICLNYFVSNDKIYRITITQDTAYILSIDWNEKDKVHLQDFLDAIVDGSNAWFDLSLYLGEKLLEGIDMNSEPQRMLVLADNFLHSIPFDILSMATPDSSRLVVEFFEVFYAPSLKALLLDYPELEGKGTATFAPNYDEALPDIKGENSLIVWKELVRSQSFKLPGAIKEANNLKELIGSELFVGDRATVSNFSKIAGQYNILHLAMHAVCEFESPNFSRLIFQQESNETNSAFCYASEIANMHIPADLVVLSACNTGNGRFVPGEGISSIARSFQYAGAKSSVYSLWKVPDISTPDLMKHFYENLKKGMDKPAALRNAKLSFIKNASESALIHPMYWAGFVVNGLPDPVDLGTESKYDYLPIVVALLVFLLLIFLISNKSLRNKLGLFSKKSSGLK